MSCPVVICGFNIHDSPSPTLHIPEDCIHAKQKPHALIPFEASFLNLATVESLIPIHAEEIQHARSSLGGYAPSLS